MWGVKHNGWDYWYVRNSKKILRSCKLGDITTETIQNKAQRKRIVNMHRLSGICGIKMANTYLIRVPQRGYGRKYIWTKIGQIFPNVIRQ